MKNFTRFLLALAALSSALAAAGPGPASAQQPLPEKLDLEGAIRYALDHNYSILLAREQIREEEGVIIQVEAQRIPNLAATGQYEREAKTLALFFPEPESWNLELEATQALFAGGGIRASVKNAKLNRDAALYDLQTTIDTALLDVRTRFYAVLLAREQVGVQEENVRLFQRQLTDAQHQFHAGTVSNFEVLRAQVSLANAQPDLITARNNYRISIEQLRQSLGAPLTSSEAAPIDVVGELKYYPAKFDLYAALGAAHEHRPELLRLSKLEAAGEQAVVKAKSTYYPSASAFGGYQWTGVGMLPPGTLGINSSSVKADGWLFGLQSTWSIFDGRATAGRVRQARSQLEQSRLTYASEELAVDVDVRQAFSSLQEAAELVQASKKTVEQADEALRLANARYHAGSATQLDVLTSQVSLTQARTNELQAYYTYSVALAAMHRAMGLSDALVSGE